VLVGNIMATVISVSARKTGPASPDAGGVHVGVVDVWT
jgi:hypothetical protein